MSLCCPQCGALFAVDAQHAGQKVRCTCGAKVLIPAVPDISSVDLSEEETKFPGQPTRLPPLIRNKQQFLNDEYSLDSRSEILPVTSPEDSLGASMSAMSVGWAEEQDEPHPPPPRPKTRVRTTLAGTSVHDYDPSSRRMDRPPPTPPEPLVLASPATRPTTSTPSPDLVSGGWMALAGVILATYGLWLVQRGIGLRDLDLQQAELTYTTGCVIAIFGIVATLSGGLWVTASLQRAWELLTPWLNSRSIRPTVQPPSRVAWLCMVPGANIVGVPLVLSLARHVNEFIAMRHLSAKPCDLTLMRLAAATWWVPVLGQLVLMWHLRCLQRGFAAVHQALHQGGSNTPPPPPSTHRRRGEHAHRVQPSHRRSHRQHKQ